MWLSIFGATGRTGRLLVARALQEGHHVTAFVRSPQRLPLDHPRLVKATLGDTAASSLASGMKGSDAVLSVLDGSIRDGRPATVWTRAALAAMEECGIERIVVTSAAPVGARGGRSPLLYRLVGWVFRDSHRDLATMEDAIAGSSAAWTIVRPPRLTNGPATGTYRVAIGSGVPRGWSLSRADLASAVLRFADDPAAVRRGVGIAY
ncbi:NAD(P)-dependent oxidoreductase [Nocardiopsis coralliicola]